MIVVIGDRHYQGVRVDELSIRHALQLQRELAVSNISSARTFGEVKELVSELATLPDDQRAAHPESVFLTALVIWAARVTAGEDVSLLEAVDVPLTSVRFLPEPTDHKPEVKGRGKGQGGGRRKS